MRPNEAVARSLLFVPGDREERFAKAAASGADGVICDLEDAVSEDHKVQARHAVARWLGDGGVASVRVNAVNTPHFTRDLAALKWLPGLRGVVVPKADDPAALATVHQELGPEMAIIALIETALGVVRATEIASTPGVVRLAFGALDFAADVGCSDDDRALLPVRSTLVVVSRATNIASPVDGVTTDLDDDAAAGVDARAARRLGFSGKLCIHPRQIAAVNAAFSPTQDELAWARRILEQGAGGGVVRVDSQMVDQPVITRARDILRRSAAVGPANERTERGS